MVLKHNFPLWGKEGWSFHPLEFISIRPTMREINVSKTIHKARHTCLYWSHNSKELSIAFSTNWQEIRKTKTALEEFPWQGVVADFLRCARTVFLLESGQSCIGTMYFIWFFSCHFQLRIPEAENIDDQMRFKSFLLVNLRDLHFNNREWCFNRFQLCLCWFQLITEDAHKSKQK